MAVFSSDGSRKSKRRPVMVVSVVLVGVLACLNSVRDPLWRAVAYSSWRPAHSGFIVASADGKIDDHTSEFQGPWIGVNDRPLGVAMVSPKELAFDHADRWPDVPKFFRKRTLRFTWLPGVESIAEEIDEERWRRLFRLAEKDPGPVPEPRYTVR